MNLGRQGWKVPVFVGGIWMFWSGSMAEGPSVLRLCLSSPWKDCWKSHIRTSKCDWENGKTTVPTIYPFLKCPRVFRRNLPGFFGKLRVGFLLQPSPSAISGLEKAIGSAFDHKLLQYQSYKVGLPRDI